MLQHAILLLLLTFVIVQACGSSGSCGCCGCRAKAKARAAKTGVISGDEPFDPRDDGNIFGLSIWNQTTPPSDKETLMRQQNPNFLFHRCCEERKLPSACVQLCHFNTYDGKILQSMFVGTHSCPMEFLPEMQFCAAQGMDHRRCCVDRSVDQTGAGRKCLTFCDQRPDLFTPIDFTYAPCFDRFEDMKRCFYDDVKDAAVKRFTTIQQTKKTQLEPLPHASLGSKVKEERSARGHGSKALDIGPADEMNEFFFS